MDNLPVFYFEVDENGDPSKGLQAIALVDKPAILTDWIAFDEHKKREPIKLAIQSEEKRIISGPILIPDLPIYRNINGSEFYVAASADTISKLVMKFMSENRNTAFKETHENTPTDNGVFLFEMYIKSADRGIVPKDYEHLPDGTAFVSAKVNNDDAWAKVKNGTFNGFSIEGFMDMRQIDASFTDEQIQSIIKSVLE